MSDFTAMLDLLVIFIMVFPLLVLVLSCVGAVRHMAHFYTSKRHRRYRKGVTHHDRKTKTPSMALPN
jgi:hypothetical protein